MFLSDRKAKLVRKTVKSYCKMRNYLNKIEKINLNEKAVIALELELLEQELLARIATVLNRSEQRASTE